MAYEHEVTIHTLGIEFSAAVFFAQDSGSTGISWAGLVGLTAFASESSTMIAFSFCPLTTRSDSKRGSGR